MSSYSTCPYVFSSHELIVYHSSWRPSVGASVRGCAHVYDGILVLHILQKTMLVLQFLLV